MMRFCFILLLLCGGHGAFAQQLKIVTKNSRSENMPYAYVRINNKTVAVTDSLGIGWIPMESLTPGDTLSAACLGAISQPVLVDQVILTNGTCELSVHDQMIEAISVYPDMESFFLKHVQDATPVFVAGTVHGNFDATFETTGEPSRRIYGEFTMKDKGALYNQSIRYHTTCDTAGMSGQLNRIMRDALTNANRGFTGYLMTKAFRTWSKRQFDMKYAYQGAEGGIMRFRVLFIPLKNYENAHFQVLLHVDESSKTVVESQFESFNFSVGERAVGLKLFAGYDIYDFKKNAPMMFARDIDYFFTLGSDRSVNVKIREAKFERK